jgi:hypothetical protein
MRLAVLARRHSVLTNAESPKRMDIIERQRQALSDLVAGFTWIRTLPWDLSQGKRSLPASQISHWRRHSRAPNISLRRMADG